MTDRFRSRQRFEFTLHAFFSMLTLTLIALTALGFGLVYRSIDWFENI